MAEIIELGGKRFRPIEVSTVEHDFTIMQLLVESGLDKVSQAVGESAADFAIRILHDVMASGKSFDLLGAFLIPEQIPDIEWTPAIGLATRAFVAKISSPADKILVRDAVVTMLLSFSIAGLFSWADSPKSSSEEPATPRPESLTSKTVSTLGAISSGLSLGATPHITWPWLVAVWRTLFPPSRKTSSATRGTSTN